MRFGISLARYIRRIRPRVLHLHTGNGFVNPSLAMTLAAAHRGRRIVTLHGVRSRELTAANHIRDQDIGERFFHAVITPTRYARQCYLGSAFFSRPNRIHSIPNLAGKPSEKTRCELRRQMQLPCDSTIVLFVARLVETKGPLVAIRAFRSVTEKHPQAVLLVAGNGPQMQECRSLAEPLGNRVRMLGHRNDIADLMVTSDVYLGASAFESFGLTTLEAMAAGATVVSFDLPATREVLGGCGLLACPADEAALSSQLNCALDNVELRGTLARRGKARYATAYSSAAVVEEHLQIYGAKHGCGA